MTCPDLVFKVSDQNLHSNSTVDLSRVKNSNTFLYYCLNHCTDCVAMLKSLPPGPVKLGVMRQDEKEEPSLADDIMNEINKNGEVDKSNQSFKASREFAEQIAPIIQTPRQLVSVVTKPLAYNYRCK